AQMLQDNIVKIAKDDQNKVLAMSQIRNDILWSRKIKISKEYDNQIHRLHVATPILSDDESIEEELIITDLDYQVSDDGNVEEETTTRSYNRTNQSLKENENLVAEEKQSLGGREKHSADDETAKWPLELLFVFSLKMPQYFDSELINF
ncbi:3219_t:CDS:2, partial [Cetraspora pellucida]